MMENVFCSQRRQGFVMTLGEVRGLEEGCQTRPQGAGDGRLHENGCLVFKSEFIADTLISSGL